MPDYSHTSLPLPAIGSALDILPATLPGLIAGSLRRGLRLLVRQPSFSLPATAVLGLGLGGLTAVGAVGRAVFLSPAPGIQLTGDLLWLSPVGTNGIPNTVSFLDYQDIAESNRLVAETIAFSWHLAHGGGRENRVAVSMVSDNYFRALGVSVRGHTFEQGDTDDRAPRAIVSDKYARRNFGAQSALGQRVQIEQTSFLIVGVSAPGFVGLDITSPAEIFVPNASFDQVRPESRGALRRRGDYNWSLAAVPFPAISPNRVSEQASLQWERLKASYPGSHSADARLESFVARSAVHPRTYSWLPELLGKLSLVLGMITLAALTAFGSLQTSLWIQRQSEVATRMALGGASRVILIQCILESLPLGLVAGLLAERTGSLILKALLRFWVNDFAYDLNISLAASLLVALGTTMVITAIVTGTTVMRLMRTPLRAVLVEGGAGATDTRSTRTRRRLVLSIQVAAAIMVTALAAGIVMRLLAESRRLRNASVSATMALPLDPLLDLPGGSDSMTAGVLHRSLQQACPTACSYASTMPLVDAPPVGLVTLLGRDDSVPASVVVVGPRFFQALGMPLLEGRDFGEQDLTGSSLPVIVSSSLAHSWGLGDTGIGRSMRMASDSLLSTIVGIAPDVAFGNGVAGAGRRVIYLPASLLNTLLMRPVILGSDGPALQRLGDELGKGGGAVLSSPRPISAFLEEARRSQTYLVLLSALAALLSVGLCLLGSYGNGALFLATKARELAIRASLGASRSQLLGAVTHDVVRATVEGTLVALFLAAVGSLLVFPDPSETLHLGATPVAFAVLVVTTASCLAIVLPAVRVGSVDPARSLK